MLPNPFVSMFDNQIKMYKEEEEEEEGRKKKKKKKTHSNFNYHSPTQCLEHPSYFFVYPTIISMKHFLYILSSSLLLYHF